MSAHIESMLLQRMLQHKQQLWQALLIVVLCAATVLRQRGLALAALMPATQLKRTPASSIVATILTTKLRTML